MKKLSFIFLLSFCAVSFCNSQTSALDFFTQGCGEELEHNFKLPMPTIPKECIEIFSNSSLDKTILPLLPKRVLNWGSSGRGGIPWNFGDDCDHYFVVIFKMLTFFVPDLNLNPHDLFHGHLIMYGENKDRLAIVFHGKEYPSDLEIVKNYYQIPSKSFSSEDKSFERRNFVFFNDINPNQNLNGKIYEVKNQGACKKYFSVMGKNTIDEKSVADALPNASLIGDINVFLPENIGQIKYRFYSGLNYLSNNYIVDLERFDTGLDLHKRVLENSVIDNFIAKQYQKPIVYFLTGL